MDYKLQVVKILHQIGVDMNYKGCGYIVSCIDFMQQNNNVFFPAIKVLYIEIAKQYNTSASCVERDIRKVIKRIWNDENNETIISKMFGNDTFIPRPTNKEFLLLLYKHLEISNDKYIFRCPSSGENCEYCSDFIYDFIRRFHNM